MEFKAKYNNLDLFTIPISFSYKDKYSYRTFIGATLTIICSIIMVTYFIIKFIEIINKSSFSIISNEYQNPKETINFTNIPILFGITDNIGNPLPLDPKLADFSVILNEYIQNLDDNGNINMNHTETKVEIERCDKLNYPINLSFFQDYNLTYFKCIKPFQSITINGTLGNVNGYRSLKIMLKRCNNLIENCYNDDYIEYIISNSRFMIGYLGYKANFYDSNKKDIDNYIYIKSIQLSTTFSKSVFYYMTLVKYKIYDNIFVNKKREQIYYLNRDMLLEYIPITNINYNQTHSVYSTDILAYFSFVFDGNILEYSKKVKKMGEIVSYIGNLFNIIYTIFKIINNYFSSKILFVDIFAQFFFEKQYLQKTKTFIDNSSLSILPNQKLPPLKSKSLKVNSLKINENSFSKSKKSNQHFNKYIEIKKSINYKSKTIDNQIKVNKIFFNRNKINEINKFDFFKYLKLYYFFPICIIKNKKNANFLDSIKSNICKTFSLENFLEVIKVSKNIFLKDNSITSLNDFNL